MAEDWEELREPGLVQVVITSWDESSAYRVFDALVDRFPRTGPPGGAPDPLSGLVVLTVRTPTDPPPGRGSPPGEGAR
ncbi:hypothetical protein SAMN05216251_10479 [Actinacidiphila alni]|uniref:Uncharacterized protein n=1 Tax=Actinacidiphila alni TaxID=380248 RepID=A0A1I2C035_9ACTN|nr:hypothetical protein SAMN05216251_10479 [Actinacidiphila alni]